MHLSYLGPVFCVFLHPEFLSVHHRSGCSLVAASLPQALFSFLVVLRAQEFTFWAECWWLWNSYYSYGRKCSISHRQLVYPHLNLPPPAVPQCSRVSEGPWASFSGGHREMNNTCSELPVKLHWHNIPCEPIPSFIRNKPRDILWYLGTH